MLGSLLTLVFVLVFNFFLFRVVQTDPIGSLFRGRDVPQETLDDLRESFGLDEPLSTQFVLYLRETAQLNFGISYQTRQSVWNEIVDAIPATVALVGVSAVLSALIGTLAGIIAAWRRNSWKDHSITSGTMVFYSMPDFWLGMILLVLFAVVLGWFPVGGITDAGSNETGLALLLDQLHHMFLPAADPHPRLSRRVHPDHPQFAARRDGRGLPDRGAGQRACETRWCGDAMPCPTPCSRW